MKTSIIAKVLVAAVLAVASQSTAKNVVLFPGAVARVTLSLTLTSEVEGTVAKDANGKPLPKSHADAGPAFHNTYDVKKKEVKVAEIREYASKFATRKYSNKEFLTDLQEAGFIEDIKGWSLVRVTDTDIEDEDDSYEVEEGISGLFIIKKGETPRNVGNFIEMGWNSSSLAGTAKSETAYDQGLPVHPPVFTMSTLFKGWGGMEFDFNRGGNKNLFAKEGEAHGVASGGMKAGSIGKNKAPVFIPGATKLTGLVGNYRHFVAAEAETETEEINIEAIIEGSVFISAGVPAEDVSRDFPLR